MEFEFDPAKDEAIRFKHGLRLSFGRKVFEDPERVIVPTVRLGDEEERQGNRPLSKENSIPPSMSGEVGLSDSFPCEGATPVNKETTIAIPADPNDPEDRDVTVAGVERGLMGRRIRRLRSRLGMSQEQFAEAFGIPVANIRQYEIGRHMPPPAVRAYLKVIEAAPEVVRKAVAG